MNWQRTIHKIDAEGTIVHVERDQEPVLYLHDLSSGWRSQRDFCTCKEAFEKGRSDKLRPAARAVYADVVDNHEANLRVRLELSLELALHRPIDRLVEDICFRNTS